jgi:ubiquinone/menaquinone biosynthesis C-methylase UbiE
VRIEVRIPLRRADSLERPAFTGERFVPGLGGIHIAYEHLHRYAFARRFVGGRRVLDLGCGLGYGAEVLAPLAREVVSLDRHAETIRQARAIRTHPLGPLLVADACRLPFRSASFDVVIAFELIEHVLEQQVLVAEIRRVLTPAGLLLASSPDTLVYSGKLGERNPFHPCEMTTDELRRIVEPYFARVAVYKQKVITGSVLLRTDPAGQGKSELLVARLEAEPPALVLEPAEADLVYNVIVCGPDTAVDGAPASSVLADVAESLALEYQGSPASAAILGRAQYREVWDALSLTEEMAKRHASGATDEDELRRGAELTKRTLLETVGIHPEDTVLEVGAGIGRIGEVLAPLCREWIGADVSENMLGHIRRRLGHLGNVRTLLLDGYDLAPLASESVDVVYCTLLFMHLTEWERFGYVREGMRVLRPGGRMLVDSFNLRSDEGWALFERMMGYQPLERPPHISTTSTPEEIETYFTRAGFADVRQRTVGPWLITHGRKPDPR